MTARPVLERWLNGASASHPMRRSTMPDWFLDTMETIIAPIDAAQPNRLPTKIKAFRTLTADSHLLEQRAELLIGSLLARHEVAFEFAQDHPDYVLADGSLGIEVGSRAIDGPWALHNRLEELLATSGSDLCVDLSFDDRPLKLGAARIAEIAEQILNSPSDQAVATARFEDIGLSAMLRKEPSELLSRVTITFAGGLGLPLASHMADIERELGNKVAEKTRQAQKIPTILMVDMSRVGGGWMRGAEQWIPSLRRALVDTPFVGLGVFFTSLDLAVPMSTHLTLADSLDSQLTPVVEQVAAAMGISPIG